MCFSHDWKVSTVKKIAPSRANSQTRGGNLSCACLGRIPKPRATGLLSVNLLLVTLADTNGVRAIADRSPLRYAAHPLHSGKRGITHRADFDVLLLRCLIGEALLLSHYVITSTGEMTTEIPFTGIRDREELPCRGRTFK